MKNNCTMTGAKAALLTCTMYTFHTFKDENVYHKILNTKHKLLLC